MDIAKLTEGPRNVKAAFDPSYSPPGKADELRTLAVAEQGRREFLTGTRPRVSGAARQKYRVNLFKILK